MCFRGRSGKLCDAKMLDLEKMTWIDIVPEGIAHWCVHVCMCEAHMLANSLRNFTNINVISWGRRFEMHAYIYIYTYILHIYIHTFETCQSCLWLCRNVCFAQRIFTCKEIVRTDAFSNPLGDKTAP
jgi:hypothetical protein